MSKNPGSLATPTGRAMQTARGRREACSPGGAPGGRRAAAFAVASTCGGWRKSFGSSVQAVRGVALAVGAGEVMAFLGPNGGRGRLLDDRHDPGPVLPGQPAAVEVYGMAPRQAVRPQGPGRRGHADGGAWLKDLTVAETVEYTARLFAVSRPVAERCWNGRASPRSRGRAGSGSARGRTAAAAVRDGPDSRPRAAHPG